MSSGTYMRRFLVIGVLVAVAVIPGVSVAMSRAGASARHPVQANFHNPLLPRSSAGSITNCPDPTIFAGHGDKADTCYAICTSGPLTDTQAAAHVERRLPMLQSTDLVHWRYVGAALPQQPAWATKGAKIWAPDVAYASSLHAYVLAFAVTDTRATISYQPGCSTDSAIGLATSTTPTGPWKVRSRPIVAPHRSAAGCHFDDVIDPDLLGTTVGTRATLYYGSFRGGVFAQDLSVRMTKTALIGSRTLVAAPSRFEATDVVARAGWYYLVSSSGTCCNGALSGYAAFVGRSRRPHGPFVDRQGVSLNGSAPGGSPFLMPSGNRWVGTGHTSLFVDRGGQWWTLYHAVDTTSPDFVGRPGLTRRPLLLDPVDWTGGWPVVRDGLGASTTMMPAPAAQLGQITRYRPAPAATQVPATINTDLTDDFSGSTLSEQWTWVRPPDPATYVVAGGSFTMATQNAQLVEDQNTASVLTEAAPSGDYAVETKVTTDIPATGGGFGATQAGLIVYGSDDDYVKLTTTAVGTTRQTSFAREIPRAPVATKRYGSTSVGPPGRTTWLRIQRTHTPTATFFTASTSTDEITWIRGATWRADSLSIGSRIGLVALGGAGFHATFDYIHVSDLAN